MPKSDLSFLVEDTSQDIQIEGRLRGLYATIHAKNRAGTKPGPNDIDMWASQYDVGHDKIDKIWKKIFDENEEEFGLDTIPGLAKVEKYLRSKYVFQRNIVTERTEFAPKGTATLSEVTTASIWRMLYHAGLKQSMADITTLLDSDFAEPYDPFQKYFESLQWDGTTDWIGKLASYVTTTDDTFWKSMLRKSLIRQVGCALGERENRYVMVLSQKKERTGKTWFIRFLNPFGQDYYSEEAFVYGKDSQIALCENFLYNLEELDQLRPHEMSRMKAAISKFVSKLRIPFGRGQYSRLRRASFWASTNEDQFLGGGFNSRWLVFEVTSISHKYREEIDIHQVWAQAYNLYRTGISGELSNEEIHQQSVANTRYKAFYIEADLLSKYCVRCKKSVASGGEFQLVSEIVARIQAQELNVRIDPKQMQIALSDSGFEKDRRSRDGHTVRGWWVKYRMLNEADRLNNDPEPEIPPNESVEDADELPF